MPEQSSQIQDKFIVRLPDGLRDRIRLAAETNNRSMNAEVVALREGNYPAPVPEKLDDLAAKLLFWLAKGQTRRPV